MTTAIVTAYTAPNLTKVAIVRFQGTDYTVKQSPKLVTTVYINRTRVTKREHSNAFHAVVAAACAEWENPGSQPGVPSAADALRHEEAQAMHEASAAYAADREQITRDAERQARRPGDFDADAVRAARDTFRENWATADLTPAPAKGYPAYTTEEAREALAEGFNLVASGGSYSQDVYAAPDARYLGRVRAVTEELGGGFWIHYAAYRLDGSRAGYAKTRVEAAKLLRPAPAEARYDCVMHIDRGPECGPECDRLTAAYHAEQAPAAPVTNAALWR